MKRFATLVLVCILSVSLTACVNLADIKRLLRQTPAETLSLSEFRDQYDPDAKFELDPVVHRIADDEGVAIKINADDLSYHEFEKPENDDFWSPVRVFLDLGLTTELFTDTNFEVEDHIVLQPRSAEPIWAMEESEFDRLKKSGKTLTSEGSWGMLDRFYLVRYNDFATGKLLEKPIISTFKVERPQESRLARPSVSMSFSPNGGLVLNWPQIPGAAEYWIVQFTVNVFSPDDEAAENAPNRSSMSAQIMAKTNETTWDSTVERTKREWFIRSLVDRNAVNEDSYYQAKVENDEERIYHFESPSNSHDESFLAVIAVNGDRTSSLSNPIMHRNFQDRLVYRAAEFTWKQDLKHSQESSVLFDQLEDLPREIPFTMLSGKTKFLPAIPVPDKSRIGENGFLEVALSIVDTHLMATLKVRNYPENWQEFLAQRADELKKRPVGGLSAITANRGDNGAVPDDDSPTEDSDSTAQADGGSAENLYGEKVFATTPLSRKIAEGLIRNQQVINVEGLPGADDDEMLQAALNEAVRQTPSSALIKDITFWDGKKIKIQYVEGNKKKRIEKANEARAALRQALKNMQLDGVDDLEKVRRIHTWVMDNTEYNYEAYELSMSDRPITPAKEGNWTTYGTSLTHRAVCEGYADAFLFLAREAGLEALGVTGNINGDPSRGHKWTAVKLNGQWRYFDPTWDDGEGVEPGTYFNRAANDPQMLDHNPVYDYVIPAYIDQYR